MSAERINSWIIIYRAYSGAALLAEQARLQTWLNNPYDSQTQGAKSYARNMDGFVDRLAAIQRVLNEQSHIGPNFGVADASGGIWGAYGASLYGGPYGAGPCSTPDSWN